MTAPRMTMSIVNFERVNKFRAGLAHEVRLNDLERDSDAYVVAVLQLAAFIAQSAVGKLAPTREEFVRAAEAAWVESAKNIERLGGA